MQVVPSGGITATEVWNGAGLWLAAAGGWAVASFCWWIRRNSWRWSGGSWLRSTPAITDGCGSCHTVGVSAVADIMPDTPTDVKDDGAMDVRAGGGTMDEVLQVGSSWGTVSGNGTELGMPTWDVASATARSSVLALTGVGRLSPVNLGMTATLFVGNPPAADTSQTQPLLLLPVCQFQVNVATQFCNFTTKTYTL